MIRGKQDKRHYVWEHLKRHHTGDKVAVIGYPKKLPQTQLRNKQVVFYESLRTPDTLLNDCAAFFERFKEQYDGVILYVDCTEDEAWALEEIAKAYKTRLTVTVKNEDNLWTEEVLMKLAA